MAKSNIEKMLVDRFDRLEGKVDKLVEDVVPTIRTEIAVVKTESKSTAKTTSIIVGGRVAVVTSVAVAWMSK